MCLLTFFPDGVIPSRDAIEGLRQGAKYNPDGYGYAMITGEEILTKKGMLADDMIDEFLFDRDRNPDGPAMFHSRIGTDGLNDEENCHPFYIGKDKQTVLAHNGILPSLARPTNKLDPRSDTRILAECLLPEMPFGSFHSRLSREAFEAWLGPYNKVIILTTNPRYPNNVLMFNQQQGHWEFDAWWSNDSYLPYYGKKHTPLVVFGKPKTDSEDDDRDCPNCKEKDSVDKDYRVCWGCGTCNDCLGNWTEGQCICYIKTRGGTKYNKCQDCNRYVCTCDDA